jgi:solute carrier family 39 (zinc transporter), member 7
MLFALLDNYSLGIFVGFASFFFMEKTLRVLNGDSGDTGHSHSHSIDKQNESRATGIDKNGMASESLRERRKTDVTKVEIPGEQAKSGTGPSKLSAYLNLFGDFVHNM